ncbi:hypothetical protein PQX77_013707 [Marasmius sp. AFHP31]|nr:hypothetical protein PQX77_013707 [Marasmius sp. AFHP31]
MKVQEQRYQARRRTRTHPYPRPSFPEDDDDPPYTPRLEDDSLLHLVFNELAHDHQAPAAIEENGVNDADGGGMGDVFVFLGLSIAIVVGKKLLIDFLLSLRPVDKQGDGV